MKSVNIEIKQKHRIGIYEKAINNKFDWNQKFQIAKNAGFDFIEISIDESDQRIVRLEWSDQQIYQLHQTAIDNQMDINSMCLSANRKFPLGSKDVNVQKRGLDIILKAMQLARKLGIRIIQLAGYDEYYFPSDEVTKNIFIQNMKHVCNLAQYFSMQIAFESMDTFFMGDLTRIMNVLKILDSPMLKIYPDIGNLTQFAKENFASEIELAKHLIIAYHFKDTTPTTFKNIPFGHGTVNFKNALTAILKSNFYGPFMIEMWNKNDVNQTEKENIEEIKNAKTFFDFHYQEVKNELSNN